MRLSGRNLAVLATLLFIGVLVFNQWIKPAPGAPGSWLFENASRELIITCTLIGVGVWVFIGLLVGYQHVMDYYFPDRHYERTMRSHAAFAKSAPPQRSASPRPSRTALPPTAPLPQAPAEAPTVTVNEQGAHSA